ncbi:MAG: autotransporter-associated beta strand repeat-containing protein, partial [Tepidisphaeraceae bacterium]
ATSTFSGVIRDTAGSLALTKAGTGTITLSGNNSYAGGTTINAGTLRAGSTTALGAPGSSLTISSTGILDLNGSSIAVGSLSGTGLIDNTAAATTATLTAGNSGTATFSGTIQNTAGLLSLTKVGSGTLVLASNSTYSGSTDIQAGTVKLGVSAPTGVLALAQYQLDASDPTKIVLDASNKVAAWNDETANGLNFTQGTAGNRPLYVANALNGKGVVRFTGSSSTQLVMSTATTPQEVFIVTDPGSGNAGLAGIWGWGSTTTSTNDEGIRTVSATAWQNQGNTNDFTYSTGGAMYINGVLQGTNPGFTVGSAHVLTALHGASNNAFTATALGLYYNGRPYTGDIGEVIMFQSVLSTAQQQAVEQYLLYKWGIGTTASNSIPDTSTVNLHAGATLDLNNCIETIGSLTGAGTVLVGNGTLSTGADNTSTAFTGNLAGASTSGGFTKVGTGTQTLTLSGAPSTTGALTARAGTLTMTDGNLTVSSNFTVGDTANTAGVFSISGGSLTVSGANFLLGQNATASPGTYTQTGGTVIFNGTSFLGISNNSGPSTMTVSGGTFTSTAVGMNLGVRAAATLNISGAGVVTLPSLTFGHPSTNGGNAVSTLNLGDGASFSNGASGILAVGAISQAFTAGSTPTANLNFNGGVLRATGNSTTFLGGLNGAARILDSGAIIDTQNFNVTVSQSLSHGGVAATDGGLTKVGSGTLVLVGNNTYTGSTIVTTGSLKLPQAATLLPSALASATYRLDASDTAKIVMDASNKVSAWNDEIASMNFTQTTAANQPLYVANGLNGMGVVRFTGTSPTQLVMSTATAPQEVFIVTTPAAGNGTLAGIWGWASATTSTNDKGIRTSSASAWQNQGDTNDFTNGAGGAM